MAPVSTDLPEDKDMPGYVVSKAMGKEGQEGQSVDYQMTHVWAPQVPKAFVRASLEGS